MPAINFLADLCTEFGRCEVLLRSTIPRLLQAFDADGNGMMSHAELDELLHKLADRSYTRCPTGLKRLE